MLILKFSLSKPFFVASFKIDEFVISAFTLGKYYPIEYYFSIRVNKCERNVDNWFNLYYNRG